MRKFLLLLSFILASSISALAQNQTCADRPSGDNSNACANTRFVQSATAVSHPGGSNGQVQYRLNSTTFGGVSGATTDGTTLILVAPILGTPLSVNLTNALHLPISTGVDGLGTGIAPALAINIGLAGAPILFNGAAGTPSSLTLTNAASLPVPSGLSATGTPSSTTFLAGDGSWKSITSTGTVTIVSVATANGFAGSVATATSTPAITLSTTITGILSGNGTAISAASTTGSGSVVLATAPTVTNLSIGAGSAITSSGPGGALGSNAFTSTAYMPLAGGTFSGVIGFSTTNTLDIGTNATTLAPRTVYAGTSIVSPIGTFTTSIATPLATLGTQGTTQGSLILANTNSTFATTLKSSNSSSVAWSLTLPPTAGTNTFVLSTDGTGITSWVSPSSGAGTVTSVGLLFTAGAGNILSNTGTASPIISSGNYQFAVTGTSGGIPFFDSSTSWNTSALLTNHALIVGGGAGAAPSTLGSLGSATTVLHGSGSGSPSFSAVSLTADISGILLGANGGTGIANTGLTITLAGNLTTTGAFNTTFVQGASTTQTLPSSSATLAGLGVTETFTAQQTFAGTSSVIAASLVNAVEPATISATAATGTINYDLTTQSINYFTSNASANWTTNFRASSGTALNAAMSTNQVITAVFMVTQGATPFYNNVIQVDGNAITPKWQGGTAPVAGNASGIDVYTYSIIKTGSAAFTILASQTQYK